jgi:hypothetical protein
VKTGVTPPGFHASARSGFAPMKRRPGIESANETQAQPCGSIRRSIAPDGLTPVIGPAASAPDRTRRAARSTNSITKVALGASSRNLAACQRVPEPAREACRRPRELKLWWPRVLLELVCLERKGTWFVDRSLPCCDHRENPSLLARIISRRYLAPRDTDRRWPRSGNQGSRFGASGRRRDYLMWRLMPTSSSGQRTIASSAERRA